MALKAEQVLKRADRAFEKNEMWRGLLSDAYRMTNPQQNIYDNKGEGQNKVGHLFDSTGPTSMRRAVNRYVNNVFPDEQKWCLLTAGPATPKNRIKTLNAALQQATEMMFSIINNKSNFQTSITQFVEEMWISTGIMTVQKGKMITNPIIFTTFPQAQVALEKGPNGSVGAKFRRFDMEAGNIKPTWEDAKLTEDIEKAVKDDPSKTFSLTEITYTDYDDEQVYYCLVNDKKKTFLVERKMRMDRFVVGRLRNSPDEVKGRGPVLDALPDLKTQNKLVELVLKNATLVISGPYTVVDDGVLNPDNVVIGPLRMIPVARNAGHPAGPSMAPLERSGDFNIAFMEYERLRTSIREALLDTDLPQYDGAPKTAAEILARVRQYVEDTGAFYGRTKREVIVPIAQNILDIMANDWKMIDPIVIDGNFINLQITSPLAMQQNIREVEAVVQGMEISKSMFGPEQTQLVFKTEEIIPWIARKLNVPETLLRDEDEQAVIKEGAAAAITSAEEVAPGTGLQIAQNSLRGA